ncbi:MAG: hypothetical protein IKY44_06745 [Clostridia bacterium]|nr:hypothetical protein [Clostridia bacterium]
MIIHSIVSPYDIFPAKCPACNTQLVQIEHGFVELDDKRTIKRVISTNPQDYLNQNYQLEKYLP